MGQNRSGWGAILAGGTALLIMVGLVPAAGAVVHDPYENALDLKPATVLEASILGSDPAGIGLFAEPLAMFPKVGDQFLIMATGKAADAYLPDTNHRERLGVGGALDDRTTKLSGSKTNLGHDLVQFRVTLKVPGWAQGFAFDFAFFTEEWPDFYGSPYADTFVAQIGADPITVYKKTGQVEAPGNMVFDANGHMVTASVGFGLDPADPNPNTGTTYDGTTGLLTSSFPIPTDGNNLTLTFSLLDVGDSIVDSAVFIDHLRFLKDAPPMPTLNPADPPGSSGRPTFGKITGGGSLAETEGGNFAGNLHVGLRGGPARGEWQYTSLNGSYTLRAETFDVVDFATDGGAGPDQPGTPYNTATVDGTGNDGHRFRLTLADRGEPGDQDEFRIQVWDQAGNLLVDEGSVIRNGNLQIHPPGP